MKFKFGKSDYTNKIITAETLDEAVNEFILACIDFSEFAYKNDYLNSREQLEEPYGYTNGLRNEHFSKHKFYELIPVYEDSERNWKLVKELSLTEFRNWHLKQTNILEDKNLNVANSETKEITSSSMLQMSNHIIQTSFKIREMKQRMALEQKYNNSNINTTMDKLNSEMKKMEQEYDHLQKKMGILKTYAGIGRDIVKVRGGKKSDKVKIDIFQSYRYMKEDIEILSDFQEFDAMDLDSFDEFLKEHYKELLPSEKCIQAFKVTGQYISYSTDIFKQVFMDKENKKIFILARNGENVYRIYNDYSLNREMLFHMENGDNEVNRIIKNRLKKDAWKHSSGYKSKIIESYIAKISNNIHAGESTHSFDNSYVCYIPYDYNQAILDTLKAKAEQNYLSEIKRREEYILKHNLTDELDIYSWRWGMSIGYTKQRCYDEYLYVHGNMENVQAYKNNDFFTLFAFFHSSISNAGYVRINDDIEHNMIPMDNGKAVTSYCAGFSERKKNDFSSDFDPITAEPLVCYTSWYDFEKYKEYALDKARDELEKELSEENFKNFNSMAILQNLLDSKLIFDDIDGVDLLFFKGVGILNFIKDGANLLDSKETYPDVFTNKKELKRNDKVYIIRRSGPQIIVHGNRYLSHSKEECSFSSPQVILATVTQAKDGIVKVNGYFDVYSKYYYDKQINEGDAKIAAVVLKDDWLIVRADIEEDEILKLLKNRNFREKEYEVKGLGLRGVLNLKRKGLSFNFKGGVRYYQ